MIREVKTISGVNYTTQYAYNKNGALTSITYPSGRVVSYTMNTTGRISQVSMTTQGTPVNLASSITYMPFGDVASLTYGNSLSLSKTYTNQYRASSITTGSVLNLSYAYDANGNITSITDSLGTAPPQYLSPSTYSYQAGSNVLTSITGTPTASFTHDSNGNITSEGNRTFTYDLSNRLITVTDGETQTASYVYDAKNLRAKKTASSITTVYHYDINGRLIAETDTSGNTLTEYVYLDDMPLAMVNPADTVYYYHNDHINTPRVMTNSSGTVVWKASYNAFGHADIDTSSTITSNLRFPGQYFDSETGLHYNWNRYYDPRTGRYLTPDPIGLEGGIDPYVYMDTVGKLLINELNLFVYTNNNPNNLIDPWGLQGFDPGPNPNDPTPKGRDPRTPWLPNHLKNRNKYCPPYYRIKYYVVGWLHLARMEGAIPLIRVEEIPLSDCGTKVICHYRGFSGDRHHYQKLEYVIGGTR